MIKKYKKHVLVVLQLLLWIVAGYAVVSPLGTWFPNKPNWVDFWVLVIFGFCAAWIGAKILGYDKEDPKNPKPPKNGKFA